MEFEPTSWPTLARDFEAGAFDIAMGGVSITLDRAKKGFFSAPYMREGKTPIARCADKDKFATLAEIDQPGVKVIANPGGTNERFDRAHLHSAEIVVYPDNLTIFDAIAAGDADLMITDASETRFQQKLHPGSLCAIHPDKPFDFAEKAYWMPMDSRLKAFVDQWLHLEWRTAPTRRSTRNGSNSLLPRNQRKRLLRCRRVSSFSSPLAALVVAFVPRARGRIVSSLAS